MNVKWFLKYQTKGELPFCSTDDWNEENACSSVELNLPKINRPVSYEIALLRIRKRERLRELTNAGSKIWKGDLIWNAEEWKEDQRERERNELASARRKEKKDMKIK